MICENCNRIIETEYIELDVDTTFGNVGFAGNICCSCKSILEYCVFHYRNLYEELTKNIDKKRLALDSSTKRGLK